MVPGTFRTDLDDIAGDRSGAGGEACDLGGRPERPSGGWEPRPEGERDVEELCVLADRAVDLGLPPQVASHPEQLGLRVADVEPGTPPAPVLPHDPLPCEPVLDLGQAPATALEIGTALHPARVPVPIDFRPGSDPRPRPAARWARVGGGSRRQARPGPAHRRGSAAVTDAQSVS